MNVSKKDSFEKIGWEIGLSKKSSRKEVKSEG
jgi:hypothetical protein